MHMHKPKSKAAARAAVVIACATLLLANVAARAGEIATKVDAVEPNGRVTIALPKGHNVRPGDSVQLKTEAPGLGLVALQAKWRIELVGATSAIAVPETASNIVVKPGFVAIVAADAAPVDAMTGGVNSSASGEADAAAATPAGEASPAPPPGSLRGALEARAKGGDVDSMLALGGYLLHGAENSGGAQPSDVSEGVRWLERAAEGGNAAASCTLGLHYQRDKDMPKALAWTQKAAQAGDPACMLLYGSMLLHGTSAPKNPEQAFGWIKRASDAGLDAASYELAQMYLAGEGAPKDKGKALELLLRVAETEHSPGAMYRAGILLIGDKPAESLKLLTAAAELGHRMAMHDVAWSYLNAPKLKHDKKKAREWAEKGAAAGEVESMNMLALLYDQGVGGKRDSGQAARFAAAAVRGQSINADLLLRVPHLWTKRFWKEMQIILTGSGLYSGPLNGVPNEQTLRAVEALAKSAKKE